MYTVYYYVLLLYVLYVLCVSVKWVSFFSFLILQAIVLYMCFSMCSPAHYTCSFLQEHAIPSPLKQIPRLEEGSCVSYVCDLLERFVHFHGKYNVCVLSCEIHIFS